MPRTRSLAWSELKIGVMTIVAVVITAITIFMLTGGRGFFWQRYSLKTRFTNVAGLRPGSPVRIAGVDVGTVTGVAFAGDLVEVVFEVNKDNRELITTASTAYLGSVSLLGESAVDINPATSGSPISEWGYVPSGRARGQIADVAEQASTGIEELTSLLRNIREGRGTVGKLITDDQLYAELRGFVASARELTEGLRSGRGSIGRLLSDPAMAKSLESAMANVETITRSLQAGEGSLGKLLKDDSLARSLSSATANLDAVVGRMNRGEGTIGKLMTDDALFTRLSSVSERLDQLTARLTDVTTRLNAGEGTAGQLLKDTRLYENMNGAVSEFQSLLAEIRKNPKTYLNVKVSIF